MLPIRLRKPTVLQSARKFARVSIMPDWLCWTVEEAARATGYSQQYIRRLLRKQDSEIEAVKIGSIFLIRQDSLKAYLREVERQNDGRFGPKSKK